MKTVEWIWSFEGNVYGILAGRCIFKNMVDASYSLPSVRLCLVASPLAFRFIREEQLNKFSTTRVVLWWW